MKIPIRYNPLGNDYDTSGGAVYGSTGCFLFRDSVCVQSNMTMTSKDVGSGSGKVNRLEMFASGSCVSATLLGGTMSVYGGTATATDVFAGGRLLVASGGVADGVNIPSAANVTAGQGGVIRNAYLYQASARLSGYQGTIADTTLGVARCSILATSCHIDGATMRGSSYISLSVGTARNLNLSEPSASMAVVNGSVIDTQISKGSVYLDKGYASNVTLGSDAILTYASYCTMEALEVQYGARLSVTINDAYDVHIQGTCPYGSMLVTNGMVSGGLYHQLACSNNARVSNVHIYANGSFIMANKAVADGLAIHGSGSGSNFTASAYSTVGNVSIMDGGARISANVNARSTMSNVRFSNESGTAFLSCLGDGAYTDISAGSNGYVYASLGNGGRLASMSLYSAGLTAGLYGTTEDVTVDRGTVLISRYGTATHVHVGSGAIEITDADASDVTISSSGTLVYNACSVTGEISGGGSNCRVHFSSGCTVSNGSLTGWGTAYFIGMAGESIHLGAGSYNGQFCTLTSVNVSEGASARFSAGSHGMIVVSSGGIYEVTSSAEASNVHVLAGGSLNCVNEAHVWACTSDAGAVVTGSNIEII